MRRYGFLPRGLAGTSRRIRLIEALRLDGGVTLYLVAADDHTLLLGRCGNTLIVAAQLQRNAAAQGGPPEDRT